MENSRYGRKNQKVEKLFWCRVGRAVENCEVFSIVAFRVSFDPGVAHPNDLYT